MTYHRKWALGILVLIAIGTLVVRFVGGQSGESSTVPVIHERVLQPRAASNASRFPWRESKSKSTTEGRRVSELPLGAISGQRTLTFTDGDAMNRFLASLEGMGIEVLGSIEGLNSLHLRVRDAAELDDLLDGSEEIGYIFPAYIPGQGSVQTGARPFGNQYLPWLGAVGDRSRWGSNVKVAVLDTGIVPGAPFEHSIMHSNLIAMPDSPSSINTHGTAVASLIAGGEGLAPNATILSYRVAGDDGSSNTVLIAEAVVAAANSGVDIINISLGSMGQSRILEDALNYATDAGVVVVASAGNSGGEQLLYPAAYDNVVGVAAIDARGEHLDFSNTGNPSIAAPGLGLTSSIGESDQVRFSGTSASSPVVAGAIAAVMTEQNTDAMGAWQLIEAQANEAGAPGVDSTYGAGIIDVGRALNRHVAGISDVALASNHLLSHTHGGAVVQVTVENRGTTPIINAPLTVQTPLGTNYLNVTTLAPGDIQIFELPVGRLDDAVRIESRVGIGEGASDQKPGNNVRVDVVRPIDPLNEFAQ